MEASSPSRIKCKIRRGSGNPWHKASIQPQAKEIDFEWKNGMRGKSQRIMLDLGRGDCLSLTTDQATALINRIADELERVEK